MIWLLKLESKHGWSPVDFYEQRMLGLGKNRGALARIIVNCLKIGIYKSLDSLTH